ncbi:hypothetical protein EI94DRAFT_1804208 [Lactarius quietus]|nr:hypothetical protein EI94DRAFT_1804208 [Lactarius quietus]
MHSHSSASSLTSSWNTSEKGFGHPLTTVPPALQDIVFPPSLINKILSVTSVTGQSGPTTSNLSTFSSSILWRKAGLRYNSNDIYFEMPDLVVDKNGTIITSSVLGKIDVNCRLSGTPDLFFALTNSHALTEPSFHASVRFVLTRSVSPPILLPN